MAAAVLHEDQVSHTLRHPRCRAMLSCAALQSYSSVGMIVVPISFNALQATNGLKAIQAEQVAEIRQKQAEVLASRGKQRASQASLFKTALHNIKRQGA